MDILAMGTAAVTSAARYTVSTGASGTLQLVNDVLVAAMTAAGLVVGAALDPVGQRLADRSRAAEEHQRLAREADKRRAGTPAPDDAGPASDEPVVDDRSGTDEPEPSGAADAHNLLAQGRSPSRTVAAAVLTGGLFAGLAVEFGPDVVLAPFAVFFAMLVSVSITDLSHRLVPRWAIYGSVALIVPLLVVTSAVDHRWDHLWGAAIGGAVAFVVFFAIWWFVPRGMGYGDVRLAGVIGITTGYLSLIHAYLAFLAGFVIGMVFGLVMMAVLASGRKTKIPFAPALAIGAVVAVFFGSHLAHSLFGTGS